MDNLTLEEIEERLKKACDNYRVLYKKFMDYLKYVENEVPESRWTAKERELVAKYGSKKKQKKSGK